MKKYLIYIAIAFLSVFYSCNDDKKADVNNANQPGDSSAAQTDTAKAKPGQVVAEKNMQMGGTVTATGPKSININNSNAADMPERPYYVKGQIIDAPGMTIVFDQLHIGQFKPLWTETINSQGEFGFEGTLKEPGLFQLRCNDLNIWFVVRPNDTISFYMTKDDLGSFKVVGSPEPGLMREMLDILNKTNEKVDALHEREKNTHNNYKSMLLVDSLPFINDKIQKEKSEKLKAFIKKADTNFTALVACQYLDPNRDFDFLEMMDKKFSRYSDNEFYLNIHNKVITLAPVAIGHYAPDLTLPDPNGHDLKMDPKLGKYTLLYFWSSDNRNCRAENKNIEKLYSKYKSKGLQLYGVSLDSRKDLWLKAIDDDGLDGTQVSDVKGFQSIGAQIYMIVNVPMVYILDKDGKIIDKGLLGSVLTAKLSSLFKK